MTTASPSLVIDQVDIDSLRPDPVNPRRITEEELDALTRSIRAWGFVEPVVARRQDAIVIGGHQRLVAARRAGLASVPVVWLDISAQQAHLLGLALNRISGAWDEQLLARLLADLKAAPEVDVSLTGFGEDEVRDLMRALAAAEKADRARHVRPGGRARGGARDTTKRAARPVAARRAPRTVRRCHRPRERKAPARR